MFDKRRATRALRGLLQDGERIDAVATDAITGDAWVLTDHRLLVLHAGAVSAGVPLPGLSAEVRQAAAGTEVRVRGQGGTTLIANFRGRNDLLSRLERHPAGE